MKDCKTFLFWKASWGGSKSALKFVLGTESRFRLMSKRFTPWKRKIGEHVAERGHCDHWTEWKRKGRNDFD